MILVALTLFGALPVYSRVAAASPHGQGSIAMLEELLPRWRGKAFVLVLLGFAATDFVITITLSAADATEHIIHNPFVPGAFDHPIGVTLLLLAGLGAVFLKGFREAIGLAVAIVAVYLVLNVVVIGWGLLEIARHPDYFPRWTNALVAQHGSIWSMLGIGLILFPKLALGLSGFETGVAVMPLVEGSPGDDPAVPAGRIRNTRKLLRAAALIMSVLLVGSSIVTTFLIPARGLPRRRPGRGPSPRVPGPRAPRRAVWHGVRHQYRSRFSGLLDRRRWRACSTWSLATCPGSGWRRSGRGARGHWWCCLRRSVS